MGSHNAV